MDPTSQLGVNSRCGGRALARATHFHLRATSAAPVFVAHHLIQLRARQLRMAANCSFGFGIEHKPPAPRRRGLVLHECM